MMSLSREGVDSSKFGRQNNPLFSEPVRIVSCLIQKVNEMIPTNAKNVYPLIAVIISHLE
tara:strand:- start:548 stop:727 length:180 start_codon:yes stop_codon:yes gene_type:complete